MFCVLVNGDLVANFGLKYLLRPGTSVASSYVHVTVTLLLTVTNNKFALSSWFYYKRVS